MDDRRHSEPQRVLSGGDLVRFTIPKETHKALESEGPWGLSGEASSYKAAERGS